MSIGTFSFIFNLLQIHNHQFAFHQCNDQLITISIKGPNQCIYVHFSEMYEYIKYQQKHMQRINGVKKINVAYNGCHY